MALRVALRVAPRMAGRRIQRAALDNQQALDACAREGRATAADLRTRIFYGLVSHGV